MSHVVTTITDLTTGQIIATVSYDSSYADAWRGGPQWLNNEAYLIPPAIDEGILYVSLPDGKVGNLVTDFLGLDPAYVLQYRSVFSQVDPATGAYHLLLKWEGGPTPLPLLLYHSELDEIETLPFYGAWGIYSGIPGIFPDGEWLLLSDPVGDEPSLEKSGGVWLRPVDPPGSEAIQLYEGKMSPADNGLSLVSQRMAFVNNGKVVYLLSFPDGVFLSRWSARGYDSLQPAAWSPDGSRLAAWGLNDASGQTALFVVEP